MKKIESYEGESPHIRQAPGPSDMENKSKVVCLYYIRGMAK